MDQKNRRNLGKINNPDAHIHDRSLSWLGTLIGKLIPLQIDGCTFIYCDEYFISSITAKILIGVDCIHE